jgi:predicted PurR-regulated permease PerM
MDAGITIAIVMVVSMGLVLVPVVRILDRVGHNRWLAVIAVFPLINLFGRWMLAFSKWPSMEPAARQSDQWSDADNEAFKRLLEQRRP